MRRHGTANVFPRMAVPPFSQGLRFPRVSVREISGVGEADARGQHEFLVPPPCLVSRPRLLHGPDHGGLGPDLAPGEVAEWLNAPHSKCGIGASLSGVRIPPSPPMYSSKFINLHDFLDRMGAWSPKWSPTSTLAKALTTIMPPPAAGKAHLLAVSRGKDERRNQRGGLRSREPSEIYLSASLWIVLAVVRQWCNIAN
jgi:hypothetical protein